MICAPLLVTVFLVCSFMRFEGSITLIYFWTSAPSICSIYWRLNNHMRGTGFLWLFYISFMQVLPVMIDVGTNNQALLDNPQCKSTSCVTNFCTLRIVSLVLCACCFTSLKKMKFAIGSYNWLIDWIKIMLYLNEVVSFSTHEVINSSPGFSCMISIFLYEFAVLLLFSFSCQSCVWLFFYFQKNIRMCAQEKLCLLLSISRLVRGFLISQSWRMFCCWLCLCVVRGLLE